MRRREFLKQATVTAAAVATASQLKAKTPTHPIARRALGQTGEQLSIIAFISVSEAELSLFGSM